MNACTRRAFLGFAQGAVAMTALSALGASFVETAEALPIQTLPILPIAPERGQRGTESSASLLTQTQWDRRLAVRADHHRAADGGGLVIGIAAAAFAAGDGSEAFRL